MLVISSIKMNNKPYESTQLFYEARQYVEDLLNAHLPEDYIFHSLSHTNDVVIACNLIAEHEQLDAEVHENLLIAACFHDTGFIKTYENHEAISIQLAEQFMNSKGLSRKRMDNIAGLINVTREDQEPAAIQEKILCDADCYYLSKSNYQEYLYQLRNEWEKLLNRTYTDKEWLLMNLNFMNSHTYYTRYAQENWNEMKANNLGFIEKVSAVLVE